MKKRVLLIGSSSGRIDCVAEALMKSASLVELYCATNALNPGLISKAEEVKLFNMNDARAIAIYARKIKPDFGIAVSEEVLGAWIVDMLRNFYIPCIGPTHALAKLETSKVWGRYLFSHYQIAPNPECQVFKGLTGMESYMLGLKKFVVKPDGLAQGKGVKVYMPEPDKLRSYIQEAISYARVLIETTGRPVLVEELLEGEEFSLMSFCDGSNIVHMPPIRDYKRALPDDQGENTGGMGSYSCEDRVLPFFAPQDLACAMDIQGLVLNAVSREVGELFIGVLYGGFMITAEGLRILEYNVRPGDPEILNVLPLMQADFVEVCEAMLRNELWKMPIEFEHKATVCKYVVPDGYPEKPVKGERIFTQDMPVESGELKIYYGGVHIGHDDNQYLTGGRAIACVGIANSVGEAEAIAEKAVQCVNGPLYHRHDIGSMRSIARQCDHMDQLRCVSKKSLINANEKGS